MLDDLVRDGFDITLNLRICVLAADETLGGKEGVFGVHDSLSLG